MGDGNSFPSFVCVISDNLAYESIVLCMCSGKYIDIYFIMKITFLSSKGRQPSTHVPTTFKRVKNPRALMVGNLPQRGLSRFSAAVLLGIPHTHLRLLT